MSKKARLILLGISLIASLAIVAVVSYRPHLNLQSKPTPTPRSVKVSKFDKTKYQLFPLLKPATPSAQAVEAKIPPTKDYSLGKATVSYHPFSNIFVGDVDNARDTTEYRSAKKALIADLVSKGINLCDLKIYWARPENVPKGQFSATDGITDGC